MTNFSSELDNTSSEDAWDIAIQIAVDRIAGRKADDGCVQRVIHRALQLDVGPSIVKPTSEQLSASNCTTRDSSVIAESGSRRRIMVMLSGFSAAAACLLALGWITLASNTAFAQIQQKLAAIRTIQFSYHSTSADGARGKVYVVEPDRYREELRDGRVFVTDLTAKQAMELDTMNKKGEIYSLYQSEPKARTMEWLVQLRKAATDSSKIIGKRKLDGKNVIDYQIRLDGEPEFLKVTVDESNLLPIRVERVHSSSGQVSAYAYDFSFDKPIEDSLVSIVAPEGFEIVKLETKGESQDVKLVVGPNGLGRVTWGMKSDEVINLLGKPDAVKYFDVPHQSMFNGKEVGRTSGDELIYDSKGFRVVVSKQNGVETITCYGTGHISDRMRPFSGRTDKDLRMGATLDAVIELYGTPEQKSESQLVYSKLGLQFQFNGQLSLIQVRSPLFRPDANGILRMRIE